MEASVCSSNKSIVIYAITHLFIYIILYFNLSIYQSFYQKEIDMFNHLSMYLFLFTISPLLFNLVSDDFPINASVIISYALSLIVSMTECMDKTYLITIIINIIYIFYLLHWYKLMLIYCKYVWYLQHQIRLWQY